MSKLQALQVSNLKKTYTGGFEALKGLNFSIDQGDFFALLGPNGAGKSTTIGILSSLVNKTSGTVKVFGHDLDEDPIAVKRCIGLVPQEFNFSIFERVQDILKQQAGYYGLSRHAAEQGAEKYLKLLELYDKRHEQSKNLSGGMKRRLMIARAMIHEPKLLILDEPTAGVDVEIRHSMWKFIRSINRQGTTVILTTHYLEEVEQLCKNVAIIDKGDLLFNSSLKDLLSHTDRQTFVLDIAGGDMSALDALDHVQWRQVEGGFIEVEIEKGTSLNTLFAFLTQHHIEVRSMRTKNNRVESLFMDLIRQGGNKE
ncbi:MAG: ABC transporter ATP-binding protein [Zetaproteobacteria bacterium]|nr:ABC transporter ATP-binding protein [Zetaproteobacteria bacterium]